MNRIKPERELKQWARRVPLHKSPSEEIVTSPDSFQSSNLYSGFEEYNVLLFDSGVNRYAGTHPMYPSLIKPCVIFTIEEVKKTLKKIFSIG